MAQDDIVWRRPTPGAETPVTDPGYDGPPTAEPAAVDWQPPRKPAVPAPRPLPPVDHDAIDDAEHQARWFTYKIGLVALAVLLFLACLRTLF